MRRIVYLGGLGKDGRDLGAPAVASRGGATARRRGVPVTVLRAAIVVGHGGISWELTRQLVDNLPAMVVPKWVRTKTQPIALDDVVRYLVGVRPLRDDRPRTRSGGRRGSYGDMLRAAKIMKGPRCGS